MTEPVNSEQSKPEPLNDTRPDALKRVQPERGGEFVLPQGGGVDDILAALQHPALRTVALEEGQCQMVLLALQKLRLERPGWDYALGEIEAQLGGQIAWPPYNLERPTAGFAVEGQCLRCRREMPAPRLLTTSAGGRYCLDCIAAVEVCRGCGCTDEVACPGGCSWAAEGLCSSCREGGP